MFWKSKKAKRMEMADGLWIKPEPNLFFAWLEVKGDWVSGNLDYQNQKLTVEGNWRDDREAFSVMVVYRGDTSNSTAVGSITIINENLLGLSFPKCKRLR